MFFSPVHTHAYLPTVLSMDRVLERALTHAGTRGCTLKQDENSYSLSLDVPGLRKEQLTIGIEGQVVRIESKPDAPRQVKAHYELPQDLDASASEATLELGVLTLKLAKKQALNRTAELVIN